MKKNFFYIVVFLVLVLAAVTTVKNFTANSSEPETTQNTAVTPAATATPAPISQAKPTMSFTLKDLKGNDVSLESLKGKRVFLNFWATWCPPCKAEMPELEKLYQETKDTDLVIITVNAGDPQATIQDFMDENKYHFTVLQDSDGAVCTKYNITGIPTSFFIDKEGKVVDHVAGALSYDKMKEFVEKLK